MAGSIQSHHTLNLLSLQYRPRLLAPPEPALLSGETKLFHALLLHLHAVPGLHGRLIVPVPDDGRVVKMLVQVVHVLEHRELARDRHVVDGAKMLRVLGQADAAAVRYDGDIESRQVGRSEGCS